MDDENGRADTKKFYNQYGIHMTAQNEIGLLMLAMKGSLCRVEWNSQAERVFVDGRATERDLYDLYSAIGWRISSLRRIYGYLPGVNDFVFIIVR